MLKTDTVALYAIISVLLLPLHCGMLFLITTVHTNLDLPLIIGSLAVWAYLAGAFAANHFIIFRVRQWIMLRRQTKKKKRET